MVFNATSNNISVISCPLVLLIEDTGVPGEIHVHQFHQFQQSEQSPLILTEQKNVDI